MDMEKITMQLIVNSGNARSKAMEAIACAKEDDFAQAADRLREADDFLTEAHKSQTDMIQEEAEGKIKTVSVLMAHAQDHLMNAITVIDLAREFVALYERLNTIKGKGAF